MLHILTFFAFLSSCVQFLNLYDTPTEQLCHKRPPKKWKLTRELHSVNGLCFPSTEELEV
jgi:hypothetical protein